MKGSGQPVLKRARIPDEPPQEAPREQSEGRTRTSPVRLEIGLERVEMLVDLLHDTIGDLQQLIEDQLRIPVYSQSLYHNGIPPGPTQLVGDVVETFKRKP